MSLLNCLGQEDPSPICVDQEDPCFFTRRFGQTTTAALDPDFEVILRNILPIQEMPEDPKGPLNRRASEGRRKR